MPPSSDRHTRRIGVPALSGPALVRSLFDGIGLWTLPPPQAAPDISWALPLPAGPADMCGGPVSGAYSLKTARFGSWILGRGHQTL